MLSDQCIVREIETGGIVIEPVWAQGLQPASVDVRVGRTFRVFENHRDLAIDPAQDQAHLTREVVIPEGYPFTLHPGEFVLASTTEKVAIGDHLSARLEGKSSLGRLGLMVHSTAGFIDPGFSGHITLEMLNVASLPIMIWPGMAVGQLCFFPLTSRSVRPYGSQDLGSKYQDQVGPTASRSFQGFQTSGV